MIPTHSPFGCPGDFFFCKSDHKVKLVIDPSPGYFVNEMYDDRKNYDILILLQGMEPKELSDISNYVIEYGYVFDKILTSFPEVLQSCINAEHFLYASCWILTREDKTRANHRDEYFNIFSTDKSFSLSFVMSQKNWLPGHKLRHESIDIIQKKRDYSLFFPQSIPMEEKYKLFENAMFHIAIENTRNVNYISEKIVDCFMSYTIPIYWGCPNIDEYFNKDGIIFFNTKEELSYILDNLTEEDYNRRIPAMLENYAIANEKYAFHADRVNEVIDKLTIQK
jgi:hypothetical protein